MCDLKAHDHSVQVATDLRSGMTLMDHGNIIDSGATLSLTPSNPPQQFMRIRSRRPVPGGTFGVKPFSKDGKPVPISEMCTLRVLYTNVSTLTSLAPRHFDLTNVYVSDQVRVPLLSLTQLIKRRCKFSLAPEGQYVTFPDGNQSQLDTLPNGLIALFPKPMSEMKGEAKETGCASSNANVVSMVQTMTNEDLREPADQTIHKQTSKTNVNANSKTRTRILIQRLNNLEL